MADSNLLIVLTVFVALCALSQLGQFLAIFGLYRKVKDVQDKAAPLISKAEATLESAQSTLVAAKKSLDDSRKDIVGITQKVNQILDSTSVQLGKIEGVVSDASDRARSQLERVDMVVGDTVDRVQGIVNSTHEGILKPMRELNALVTGVKSGFGFLFGAKRPPVNSVTQDEEMFI